MYTENSARLNNQLLTIVTSGWYDGEGKKILHLFYMIHLGTEFSQQYHILIYQRKGKN